MSDQCKTIRVRSDAPGHQPEGFVVINESDFDPAVHEPFDAPEAPKTDKQTKAAKASKVQE